MRLFVALPCRGKICRQIRSYQEAAAKKVPARYVPVENLHLTLAFIGEQPSEKPVIRALSGVRHPAFTMELTRAEKFGDALVLRAAPVPGEIPREEAENPLRAAPDGMRTLSDAVREALRSAGIPFDPKPQKPHITVARKYRGPLPDEAVPRVRMRFDSFALMQSELTASGARYRCLGEFPLGE